jgi:hypothetical protein
MLKMRGVDEGCAELRAEGGGTYGSSCVSTCLSCNTKLLMVPFACERFITKNLWSFAHCGNFCKSTTRDSTMACPAVAIGSL